jgi:hypothetical protein
MRCTDTYGETPCIAELDGEATHGVCPACTPAAMAEAREAGLLFFALPAREINQPENPVNIHPGAGLLTP